MDHPKMKAIGYPVLKIVLYLVISGFSYNKHISFLKSRFLILLQSEFGCLSVVLTIETAI